MSGWALLAAVSMTTAAIGLLAPPRRTLTPDRSAGAVDLPAHTHPLLRFRALLAGLSVMGGVGFVGGAAGALVGLLAGIGCWLLVPRLEPPGLRREREELAAQTPVLAALFAVALEAGADPTTALDAVGRAVGDPARSRLSPHLARLRLGSDPVGVWSDLAAEPEVGELGATLLRAHRSGAAVSASVRRLADDLGSRRRHRAEDTARTVGVRAAVPLGVCLLPAFLALGIVPLVAGLALSMF